MTQAEEQDSLQAYVEKLSIFFSVENRMPHSVAKVLALLLVSNPPHQSAEQIVKKLKLSTGAVNGALKGLLQTGIIKRVALTGDRRYYYEFDTQGWEQTFVVRLKSLKHGVALLEEGLELPTDSQRLKAAYDMYVLMEAETENLIKRLADK